MSIFVTFEGTEGVGKSTLTKKVAALLRKKKIDFILTREPGGIALAEKIRKLILKHQMNPWTELFLYEAARVEHFKNKIEPALKKKKIVLCDRFTDSSLAYQGHARNLPWKEVIKLNLLATQGVTPDLTVFLDGDPAIGLKKARVITRFEKEGLKFLRKVRQGFLKAQKVRPGRWLVLKAFSQSPDHLAKTVVSKIEKKLRSKSGNKKQI